MKKCNFTDKSNLSGNLLPSDSADNRPIKLILRQQQAVSCNSQHEDYSRLGSLLLPPPPVRGHSKDVEVCEAGAGPGVHGDVQPPGDYALHQRDPVRLGRLQSHRGHRLHHDLHQRHPGCLRLPEVRV